MLLPPKFDSVWRRVDFHLPRWLWIPPRWQPIVILAALALYSGMILYQVKQVEIKQLSTSQTDLELFLSGHLETLLPQTPRLLSNEEEGNLETVVDDLIGIPAKVQLGDNRLNIVYGYMGREQHLPRYPGDSLYFWEPFYRNGMTPARGAFGYFADSKDEMTDEIEQREKYYIAVQTLYLPNWNSDWVTLKPWYQWRKMLVINPENGRAVVAVVGDAGPAKWTGKHFGGSPEVMYHLDYEYSKMPAVVMFIPDEMADEVELGPVVYAPRLE